MAGIDESLKYLEGVVEILCGLVDSVLIRDRVARGISESCVGGVSGANPDLSRGARHGMVRVGTANSGRTTGAGEGHSKVGVIRAVDDLNTSEEYQRNVGG